MQQTGARSKLSGSNRVNNTLARYRTQMILETSGGAQSSHGVSTSSDTRFRIGLLHVANSQSPGAFSIAVDTSPRHLHSPAATATALPPRRGSW